MLHLKSWDFKLQITKVRRKKKKIFVVTKSPEVSGTLVMSHSRGLMV